MLTAYTDAIEAGGQLPDCFRVRGADATPHEILRQTVPLAELRHKGIFFTGSVLAEHLWNAALTSVQNGAIVVDPACGAGDLLMPAVNYATACDVHNVTFRGADIDGSFSRLAGARMRAATKNSSMRIETLQCNFLNNSESIVDATHVVMNPPFVPIRVDTDWAHGKVNAAAWFVAQALEGMRPGSRLLAVLPEVLRSGSRYAAWRRHVQKLSQVTNVQSLGRFDANTDVDVFTLDATAGAPSRSVNWVPPASKTATVGNLFTVRVGAVIPHRHQESGENVEFVTARSLSSNTKLWRQFSGRLEVGPMVLINRTSRPGENPRVRARIRTGSNPVAVENHLLVLAPINGREQTCHDLLDVLSSTQTENFLDNRIRCRHLTVGAIKEIPWTN